MPPMLPSIRKGHWFQEDGLKRTLIPDEVALPDDMEGPFEPAYTMPQRPAGEEDARLRSKVTPANISRFKGRKKKIFCRAGILHVGPK